MNNSWEAFASLVGQLFAREAPHALVRAPQDDVENLGKLRILKQGKQKQHLLEKIWKLFEIKF